MESSEARLWIIDDAEDDLQVFRRFLRKHERLCTPSFIESGVQAMELLEQGDVPDLIILDLRMTPVGGLQILRAVREKYGGLVPVIMVSGGAEGREVLEAYDLGANAFIEKPSHHAEFVELLASTLGFWLRHALRPSGAFASGELDARPALVRRSS
ncbi:MAG: response regulator [Myxococcota bacterium]